MSLQKYLQKKIAEIGIENVAKQVGYNAVSKGADRICNLINEPSCGLADIERGEYDFVHSRHTLLEALCQVLECPEELVEQEWRVAEKVIQERKEMHYRRIRVKTNFKRTTESLWTLMGFQNRRWITSLDTLCGLSREERIKSVSEIVRQHYINNEGSIKVFGAICGYAYYDMEGEPPVLFGTLGQLVDQLDCKETYVCGGCVK